MKKILALVVAMLLVLGMTSALAATQITIHHDSTFNPQSGDSVTYTWYKILNASLSNGTTITTPVSGEGQSLSSGGAISYSVDSANKKTALESTNLFTFTATGVANEWEVKLTNQSTSASTIAGAFKTMLSNATYASYFDHDDVVSNSSADVVITPQISGADAGAGYYYIVSSLGTDAVLETITTATINEKNTYPTIDKTEKDDEHTSDDYSNGDTTANAVKVAVGDVIDYKLHITIPADMSQDIVITDTMTNGLKLNAGSITLSGSLTADVPADAQSGTNAVINDYEITSTADHSFVVTLHANNTTRALSTLDITFNATVTADAITVVKKNDVELAYGNYHQKDTVPFHTYKAAAYKHDGANYTTALENVEFTLTEGDVEFKVSYDTTGGYYYPDDTNGSATVKTDANGLIKIRGLDNEKVYKLTETKNPNPGYNMITTGPVTLILVEDTATDTTAYAPSVGTSADDANKATEIVTIANNKGTVLPSTGGIGTTLFYVGGGILVLLAVIFLVTKRRMGSND